MGKTFAAGDKLRLVGGMEWHLTDLTDLTVGKVYTAEERLHAGHTTLCILDDAGDFRPAYLFDWEKVSDDSGPKIVRTDTREHVCNLFRTALDELVRNAHGDVNDALRLIAKVENALAEAQDLILKRSRENDAAERFRETMNELGRAAGRE